MTYEMFFLSDLLKKSRGKSASDFNDSLRYIYGRIESLGSSNASSQFNERVKWLKRLIPLSILVKLLHRMRYDAMMGFCRDGEKREIYGMISFQKHPSKKMIGMFDIYLSPSHRDKDLVAHFQKMAHLVYSLCRPLKEKGYAYIQCGKNETTQKLLRLYQRVSQRNEWESEVDIEQSRIYFKMPDGRSPAGGL